MHSPEIELKFPVTGLREFRRMVENLGFALKTERTFEQNMLYDTPDRALRARGQVLRLRNYGPVCVLTHKRMPDEDTGDLRHKTRIETETIVEDCEAMVEIFAQLGYVPAFQYDKYRTEWTLGDGHLVLDETPVGVFAELEGPAEWIDAMLVRLGVPAELTTTLSYGRIFLDWKEANQSDAEHMTFEACAPAVHA